MKLTSNHIYLLFLSFIGVPPLLEDPYESKFVIAGKSRIGDNAGDGLFLKKDVKANTTISFYNGIRVKPGEHSPFENSGYQIYVDWNKAGVRFFSVYLFVYQRGWHKVVSSF